MNADLWHVQAAINERRRQAQTYSIRSGGSASVRREIEASIHEDRSPRYPARGASRLGRVFSRLKGWGVARAVRTERGTTR